MSSGRMMGLKEREKGQMGVKLMTWALGWEIEPPHERF